MTGFGRKGNKRKQEERKGGDVDPTSTDRTPKFNTKEPYQVESLIPGSKVIKDHFDEKNPGKPTMMAAGAAMIGPILPDNHELNALNGSKSILGGSMGQAFQKTIKDISKGTLMALQFSGASLKQGANFLGSQKFHVFSSLAAGYSLIWGYLATRKFMREWLRAEAGGDGGGGPPRDRGGGGGGENSDDESESSSDESGSISSSSEELSVEGTRLRRIVYYLHKLLSEIEKAMFGKQTVAHMLLSRIQGILAALGQMVNLGSIGNAVLAAVRRTTAFGLRLYGFLYVFPITR